MFNLILAPLALLAFVAWWGVQSLLLRAACRWVAQVDVSWPMAAVTVLLAAAVQGCTMGALVGADGGCVGTLIGWMVWSGVLSFLNGLPFARALLVGLVMAVLNWLMALAAVAVLVTLGLGAALGLGALGLAA